MKPIEPGCLCFVLDLGVAGTVNDILGEKGEEFQWGDWLAYCPHSRIWEVLVHGESIASPEPFLIRIDGYEEEEKKEEVVLFVKKATLYVDAE